LQRVGQKLIGSVNTSPPLYDLYPPSGVRPPTEPISVTVPIEHGRVRGDEVSFTVIYLYRGLKSVIYDEAPRGSAGPALIKVDEKRTDTFVAKYTGRLEGDWIKGKAEFGWNGRLHSTAWEAHRQQPPK
jgi:hypothetical protein